MPKTFFANILHNVHVHSLKDTTAPYAAPTTTTTTTTTRAATTGGMVLIIRLPKVHEPSIVKCRKSRQYIILFRENMTFKKSLQNIAKKASSRFELMNCCSPSQRL